MFSLKNFLMATLLIFALSVGGVAEAGIVTDKVPLQCYVDHKVKSYDKNNGREVGWIDAEVDLVQITGIGGNGVAIGTHPSGSRRVERIFWARDVFEDPGYRNRNVHVNGSHQVFRTKNSGATIGSIANEEVTVVADNGNRAQIIYRLNNGTGYKMGWVPSSIVANNQPVVANFQLSNYNLSNPSDHQLRFTGRVWNANNNSEITGVHVYIGGGVGAGGEFMGEFRSDSNHNFDATLNVPQHRNGNQLIVIYAVNGKDAGELNRTNINVSSTSNEGFSWPVPGNTRITTTYSYSSGKVHSSKYYYQGRACGIDIAVPIGTEVRATASGTVTIKKDKGNTSFGKYIEIRHDDGTFSIYAHLSNFSMVEVGQRVNKGEVIALSGNSGNSSGPHLHFELSGHDTYQYFKQAGVI